ncbi:hypothetical protein Rsub_09126 [Raphidocelis subcapitata]|uniref:COX assembly mitochondrial protein n=1 Tax=Raphidocelis subcapitata TaxID=307507 RepID=A0A2V0PF57_9CHLO|nr:hypothetical protein Rsub_09126 [Raphidocelis subcapitata]|eukprot:GBF96543.1 hypothetical protein Rsub_09126 [Raphidocelis subcapitata]
MGRNARKEPDLRGLSKKLTSQRIECTEEIKALMDCMARQGLVESDESCTRQRGAALLCMKHATKRDTARAEINMRLQRITALFKRYGFR